MAVCGEHGAVAATKWGKWNMDAEGWRTGLGETGNPGWRERRRTDGAGWGHAGPGSRHGHGARDRIAPTPGLGGGPLRRSAFRRVGGGASPVYRRTTGTARCTQDEFVAEAGVNGASRRIRASDRIPEIVPPLQDSGGYEGGQRRRRGPPTRRGPGSSQESGRAVAQSPRSVSSVGQGRLATREGAGDDPVGDALRNWG